MAGPSSHSPQYPVGVWGDVAVAVEAWDAVTAPVDLSVACLFEQEAPGAVLHGGMGHLDVVLGGRLVALRAQGAFRAERLDLLLISAPPAPIQGKTLMIVGLGDPTTFKPNVMRRAIRAAVGEAARLSALSAAFAPSLLDAGLTPEQVVAVGPELIGGLVDGLAACNQLTLAGLTNPVRLKTWTIDANAAHAESVAIGFRRALAALRQGQEFAIHR